MVEAQRVRLQYATANDLLADLRRRVRLPEDMSPVDALRAVSCSLTLHASGGEAGYLFNALPPSVQPLLGRCARHRFEPASFFEREAFLAKVAEHIDVSPGEAEDITSAVVIALSLRLRRGEVIDDVANHLPSDLRHLWVARRAADPYEPHPVLSMIERRVTLPAGISGAGAFVAVMSALLQRLSRRDARHLIACLPVDLRALLADALLGETFEARREEPEAFDREELLARVAGGLAVEHPEPIARAVFRSTHEYLHEGAFVHLMARLPRGLQDLWVLP